MYNDTVSIIIKHGESDFTLNVPDIPMSDPLFIALMDKYANDGYSVRGTIDDITEEVSKL